MRALLRYVLLKSIRERFIAPLLLFPVLTLGAPMVGLSIRAALFGRTDYPIFLARTSPIENLVFLLTVVFFVVAIAAGVAAFWIFRKEIGDRSIASLVMATHPASIPLAAVFYGTVIGSTAFVIALPLVFLMLGTLPIGLGLTMFVAIVSSLLAASAASLLASLSADPGMLLPLLLLAPFVKEIAELDARWIVTSLVLIILCPLIAARMLERRCTA